MTHTTMIPPLPKDGVFCQLFCFRIDMAESEQTGRDLGPAGMGELLGRCHALVDGIVASSGGRVGGWQGDGAVAFFATTGDERELVQRGEQAARRVLDELALNNPEHRFRIGAATGRGRFRDALGQISEDSVILAARLESEARNRAKGSGLLLPADVHALLGTAQGQYHSAGEREGLRLFVYCPKGSAPIPPPASPSAAALMGDMGFERIDPEWPWDGKPNLYYAFAAWPTTDSPYQREKHKTWIQENYLRLPIGGRIFDDESLSAGWLLYYAAEQRNSEKSTLVRFKRQGTVIFGDAGLSLLGGGWRDGFYPQAMRRPLEQFLAFIQDYYVTAHGYSGQVFVRAGFVNVAGRKRLVDGPAIGVRPFTFKDSVIAGGHFLAPELGAPKTLKALYDDLMLHSELDPAKFGAPA